MKKNLARRLLPAALMLVSSVSLAGGPDNGVSSMPNDHQGFYLSGDGGVILNAYNGGGGYDGGGLGGAIGYMFNQYIGLEAQLFGAVSSTETVLFDNYTQLWYGGALKLNLPVGSNFAFFLKGGVGALYTSFDFVIFGENLGTSTNTDIGGIVGGGIGYSFNQNSELSLEANGIIVAPKDDAGNRQVSYITLLGLAYTYHFQ